MHDPETLVWSLGRLQCWHHDPCTDGTDNSFDNRFCRPSRAQKSVIEHIIKSEIDRTDALFTRECQFPSPVIGIMHAAALLSLIHEALGRPAGARWPAMRDELAFRNWSSMAFMPGYHCNNRDHSEPGSWGFVQYRSSVAHGMAYQILVRCRPWWARKKYDFLNLRLHWVRRYPQREVATNSEP